MLTSFFTPPDWSDKQTEAAQSGGDTKHLWEESWDDDDTTDDFSTQLKLVPPDPGELPSAGRPGLLVDMSAVSALSRDSIAPEGGPTTSYVMGFADLILQGGAEEGGSCEAEIGRRQ